MTGNFISLLVCQSKEINELHVCRVIEGLLASFTVPQTLALLWPAKASGDAAPDPASAHLLAAWLMRGDVAFTATFFAVGSARFG